MAIVGSGAERRPPARKVPRRSRGAFPLPVLTALLVLAAVLVGSALFPLLHPGMANQNDLGGALQPPSPEHWMGTDQLGRDVLARFLAGAWVSMLVGAMVVVVGSVLGGLVGLIAGVTGGLVDILLMRLNDALLAFPSLMLAMAVTIVRGPGLTSATIGVTLAGIPWFARVARSEAMRLCALPLMESCRAMGMTRTRMVTRHVLPHMFSGVLIQATSTYGTAILAVAGLGFLGLGAQPPTAEWGAMITSGLEPALAGEWWVALFPGLGILLAVTALNVIADWVRDVLDPRGLVGGGAR
ncbi:ABC transporter permease [Nocardioides sp. LHD-245]|uniref:ABC transporter permease n=1 Tax=Nocardioides sp. LHD-245 TaxID=3051387 RepID=UPI0027E0AAF9|nr:ABC transporter permease [Nocardioides sp. LHD-245]